MKKIITLILALIITGASNVKADEGMWLLPLIQKLNVVKMQEMGLKLSADDIYNVNNSSLKDAVVIFGGGCTGEVISDKGLILTNHHCGYGSIQALSSVDHNYLKDGFWAKSYDKELPSEGLSVVFMKYMTDVTKEATKGVTADMQSAEYDSIVSKNIKGIVKAEKEKNDYDITVKGYFENNQYFLIASQRYTDVRFVGAPPSSIGKFGFDTDNWVWPRHTGDFSMFRVYADKNGNPADYSEDNVPLVPKHHLPISLKGLKKDDFAMTIGYPGSTSRYLSSMGIEERMDVINATRIKTRGEKQELWLAAMESDEKINIQYASKYAGSSNYWKNSIGMNKGLEDLDVVKKKQDFESKFQKWADASPERKELYGDVLSDLKKIYTEREDYLRAVYYVNECIFRGTEIVSFGLSAKSLATALEEENEDEIKKATDRLRTSLHAKYKDYCADLDHDVFARMLKLYSTDISSEFQPSFYNDVVNKKYKGDYQAYADMVFKKSIFASQEKLDAFLDNPSLKVLQKDPVYVAATSTREKYNKILDEVRKEYGLEDQCNRLFMKGIMEMQPNKVFYPDANFTMRLSYGTVGDYEPRDAVSYGYYTTLKGVFEKEIPGSYEYSVPEKLHELYNNKDYGQYGDVDGTMHVCFTTNNDITGGNSGSPVINANGELFGIAFDGNWEAMSGDIAFEPELQKCINVDIRYILFIIDKYAGAENLIDEMTLIK